MKHQTMHTVPVTLTKKQAHKLMLGHTVQLKHESIAHGRQHKHHLVLHHESAKKVHKAAMAKKGVRLALSPHEIQMSGEGLFDFFKDLGSKIKQGYDWTKQHIIDTPFYQQTIKPIAHDLVDRGIETFVPAGARSIAHDAANAIGSKTGAFGLRLKKHAVGHKKRHMPKKQHMGYHMEQHIPSQSQIALDWNTFIPPTSAAYEPGMPLRPIGGMVHPMSMHHRTHKPMHHSRSGSFMPSGY